MEAVVDAGKHVYCEKPVAVDVTGCKRVMRIGEKVQNRFSLDIGLQCRHAPPYEELARRVQGGALGKIACGAAYYQSTGAFYPPFPNASPLERRIRTFFWDRVISGGILVDQSIHLVDLCNWMLGAHPLKAIATGGRRIREDAGDCWDHYDIAFTYPNDVHLSLNSFQGGKALSDVSIRLFGAQGVAELHYMGAVGIYGEQPWEWEGSIGRSRRGGGTPISIRPQMNLPGRMLPAFLPTPSSKLTRKKRRHSLRALPAASFITKPGWGLKRRLALSLPARPRTTSGK